MATLTCPACTAAVQQDDLICFTCGANLPRDRPVNEPDTPPTVMQEYLRPDGAAAGPRPSACPHCGSVLRDPSSLFCLVCGQPVPQPPTGVISPVVLRLSFPTSNVEVPAGTSLVLGRDPEESLVAAAFADLHDDVGTPRQTTRLVAALQEKRARLGDGLWGGIVDVFHECLFLYSMEATDTGAN